MMIEAYARGFAVLGDPAYRRAAERAADFALKHLRREDGGLWRGPSAGDFAADGVLRRLCVFGAWADGTVPGHRRGAVVAGCARVERRDGGAILGPRSRGFFFTEASNALIVRSKFAQDSALPSGNAVAAHALLDLADLTGQAHYRSRAAQILSAFSGAIWAQPSASVHLAAAAERHLQASLSAAASADAPADSLVSMRVELPAQPPVAGEAFAVAVHLSIRPGWHINANPPSATCSFPPR